LGAQRTDARQPAAAPLGAPDAADEVHIRNGGVIAPYKVELGVLGKFGRATRHRAIGPGPGLAAHPAAQGAAVKLARAEPMEEAQRHAIARQETMRPGTV